MSKKSLAKAHDAQLVDHIHEYRKLHGPCRMEDVAVWLLKNDIVRQSSPSPEAILTKKLKLAARRTKVRDAQGRSVRELIAAKVEREDASGQKIIDVVWDHIHEMSLTHALTSFSQIDEGIDKQRISATRNLASALENNPHLSGAEHQFSFRFVLEAPAPEPTEVVDEPVIPTSGGDGWQRPGQPR